MSKKRTKQRNKKDEYLKKLRKQKKGRDKRVEYTATSSNRQ